MVSDENECAHDSAGVAASRTRRGRQENENPDSSGAHVSVAKGRTWVGCSEVLPPSYLPHVQRCDTRKIVKLRRTVSSVRAMDIQATKYARRIAK